MKSEDFPTPHENADLKKPKPEIGMFVVVNSLKPGSLLGRVEKIRENGADSFVLVADQWFNWDDCQVSVAFKAPREKREVPEGYGEWG